MSMNWSKELAEAYKDLQRNKREIESTSPSGTPGNKPSEFRKRRKPKGKVS